MKWVFFAVVVFAAVLFVVSKQKNERGKVVKQDGASRKGAGLRHPIPVGDDEVTLWEGRMSIEFTYRYRDAPKRRVKLDLQKVIVKEVRRVYLVGVDKELSEVQEFFVHRLETMVQVSNKRYAIHDFMKQVGIDLELYEDGEHYRDAYKSHQTLVGS